MNLLFRQPHRCAQYSEKMNCPIPASHPLREGGGIMNGMDEVMKPDRIIPIKNSTTLAIILRNKSFAWGSKFLGRILYFPARSRLSSHYQPTPT